MEKEKVHNFGGRFLYFCVNFYRDGPQMTQMGLIFTDYVIQVFGFAKNCRILKFQESAYICLICVICGLTPPHT